ncbi:MAG: hypothetical protein K6F14_00850 [Clostridiales bacterium]|nr:hypothetical protein [Clostridiales bacterium]
MKNTRKILSVLLAVGMLLSVILLASCNGKKTDESTSADTTESTTTVEKTTEEVTTSLDITPFPDGTYTYKDAVGTLATNWNPHTYQTADDSYPAGFIRTGLYDFFFNDELHPVEGKDPYAGYKIVPEMAASTPVDVTEQVKASNPEYGIPADATKGYAYTIDLNPNAVWENGEKINADTYVYSMKRLLDPELLNYRAQDYIIGSFVIANGANYYYQGTTAYMPIGVTTTEYLASGGKEEDLYIDVVEFWNTDDTYVDEDGNVCPHYVSVLDETVYGESVDDAFSGAELYEVYLGSGAPYEAYSQDYVYYAVSYPSGVSFDTVGIKKTGEYQIMLVFGKSIAGFQLLYNLSSNWIVNETLYEANLSKIGETDAWSSTYNTSVETTLSYGPYKLVSYQKDKSMRFEKNETWYGYSDGKHVYVDPEDGKTYEMYQTTAVDCQVVAEAATRKLMFLKGQLMTYGLQSEDVAEYRNSEYCYTSPSETIFFFIFNGYVEQLAAREQNEGFDATKYDLQTMALKSFRKAIALTYDKDALCEALFPDCSPGFGLIGNMYIYDPDTGAKYRDTDVAKQVLCDFYSVDVSKYDSLDEAVDSITGYDPVTAKEFYKQAFAEALEAGYITDTDNDGKSDQTIYIEYCCSSAVTEKMQQRIDILNEKANEVTKDTPFEGKILYYPSAPYGNDWSTKIRQGLSDVVLGGWQGSALDPFGVSDLYVNPERSYDGAWFEAEKVIVTMNLTIDGTEKEITMNLKAWSDALNGTASKDTSGVEYNFGEGQVPVEVRLAILAKIESTVLQTYDYIPVLQDGSMFLLTQQAYYVIEEYNPILGRGGIAYMKYNYNDADWDAYVASQPDGQLSY